MGLAKDIWERIKAVTREPRPIVYVRDEKGKEIKFDLSPRRIPILNREPAARGGKAAKKIVVKRTTKRVLTNHGRVIAGRARRQGISVAEYRRRWIA